MITILSDKSCERFALTLLHRLYRDGYSDFFRLQVLQFQDLRLELTITDEEVWRLCQAEGYLFITTNRSTEAGEDTLKLVMQRFYSEAILPVLTVGDLERVLKEPSYCEGCADAVAKVLFDLDSYRGIPRLYIPFPQ